LNQHNDVVLEGVLAFEKGLNTSRPAVLILHGCEGRSEAQIDFAKKLADWGYVGFASDLYGQGVAGTNSGEWQKLSRSFL
jgi:dienelactone hydrolase